MLYRFLCLAALLAVSTLAVPASAEVVYDNSTTPTRGVDGVPPYAGDGFWPFTMNPDNYLGDEVILAGSARNVVQVDVELSSTELTTLASLTLGLFAIQDEGPYPETLLWSGQLSDVEVNGPTTVSFSVPEVQVPDRFVWAVAGPDTATAGLAVFDPPTVGSSPLLDHPYYGNMDYYWHSGGPGLWGFMYFEQDPVANFGATITAVPEPATLVTLALSAGVILRRRKR